MCVKQDSFDRLVETVQEIKLTLNDVKNTGDKTNDQATRTNNRVYKLEDNQKIIEENIHTLKRYRAGRYIDCPNREDIDTMKTHMVSQKAVKREMRWWFVCVTVPVLALLVAILTYMHRLIG